MDRTEGIAVFTLKTVAKFINSMNFNRVIVFEAHSDVTLALIDRVECVYMYQTAMIDEVMAQVDFDKEKDFLFYPDAGAEKRYKGKIKGKSLFGIKQRNFETRKIESFQIAGNTLATDSFNRVIIVDDLSSYGRTFLESAEALHEQFGFKEIYLVVGHAEDKIIEGEMIQSKLIKKIFTTDSILTKSDDKIHVFDEFGFKQYE
jgi:ribose-phosphate pyrophosphokinase